MAFSIRHLSFAVSTPELREALTRLIPWFARQPVRAVPA